MEIRITMTESELERVEAELSITLPGYYKGLFLDRLKPGQIWSDTTTLCHDAAWIIKVTHEYRDGYAGAPPWPATLLFVGDEDDACPYVLDLAVDPVTVYRLDHGDYQRAYLGEWSSIEAWFQEKREDLDLTPVDPSGDDVRPKTPLTCLSMFLLLIAVAVLTGIAGVAWA
jgi:hypothetical protein